MVLKTLDVLGPQHGYGIARRAARLKFGAVESVKDSNPRCSPARVIQSHAMRSGSRGGAQARMKKRDHMAKMLRFAFILPCALGLAPAQDVTGDWLGTLAMPNGERRIALHISKTENGLTATLDSIEQAVTGAPLDSVTLAGSTFSFAANIFHFSYEGQVDVAGTSIDGTISSKDGSAPLTFRRGLAVKTEHKRAKATDIDGDWSGSLSAAGQEQKYLFHIMNTEDGLIVTMDLPSQYVKGAESSSAERNDASLVVEWKVFGSRFEGKIGEDRNAIEGTVSQAGQSFPFTMKRVKP